jgi:hypothetical protein
MRRLSTLLLGGEALPVDLTRQLRRELPGALFNLYGPTETTIWSAAHRVNEVGMAVPIGRPIANTEIGILDTNQKPVPINVPGELWIGGAGVARGYLNRPDLTAGKFVVTELCSGKPTRAYRTGDLARWRADGTLEFLGRLDQQIKLRGHRIELGEIEAAVRAHPLVRDCAVALRGTGAQQRLVAYVVAAGGDVVAADDLRQSLETKLPDYMIPSRFVALDRLPLTPNGKLDRNALPADEGQVNARADYVPPRTAMEHTIAGIWQELLRVDRVGRHDGFFELGGHSLLVVQAQARLQSALGVELPVVRLFQYPTVSALANFLGDGNGPESRRNGRERGQRQRASFARRNLELVA